MVPNSAFLQNININKYFSNKEFEYFDNNKTAQKVDLNELLKSLTNLSFCRYTYDTNVFNPYWVDPNATTNNKDYSALNISLSNDNVADIHKLRDIEIYAYLLNSEFSMQLIQKQSHDPSPFHGARKIGDYIANYYHLLYELFEHIKTTFGYDFEDTNNDNLKEIKNELNILYIIVSYKSPVNEFDRKKYNFGNKCLVTSIASVVNDFINDFRKYCSNNDISPNSKDFSDLNDEYNKLKVANEHKLSRNEKTILSNLMDNVDSSIKRNTNSIGSD